MQTKNRAEHQQSAKLQPKEHGAYAILSIPILTSLIMAGPSIVGIAVTLASVAGFLANKPLLIASGHRGRRAQQSTTGASRRLAVLIAVTVGCGTIAMIAGDTNVRIALVLCLLLASITFALSMTGKHRTLGGQMWGVVGLSVPCVPILLGGGMSVGESLWVWLTFLIGFSATTMAVRGVIAAQKRQPRTIHWLSIAGLCAVSLILVATIDSPVIAALPMILISIYLMFDPPPARQLRRVGWSLVAGTVATAAWMVAIVI